MPFTFSHPSIILALNYLPRRWISMTGLVIGSMTPDFEYFFRMRMTSTYSHTISGLFWFDLPVGFLLTVVYTCVVKNALIDHLPIQLTQRFSKFKGLTPFSWFKYLIVVSISVLTGALTHILWDGFTHFNGAFVKMIPELSTTVSVADYHFPLYKIIQHSSSLIGALTIILVIYALPKEKSTKIQDISRFWIQVILVAATVMAMRILMGLNLHRYGDVFASIISVIFIGIIIASFLSNNALADSKTP